uniref:Putative secreted protein n=1 Tax=Ixodes ricinus TaxID=34613 RepID=A0A0K8RCF9_IXORI
MRVIFVALLSASFILCRSTQAKTHKKKTSDGPVVTISYLLYEPKVKGVTWEFQFNSSLRRIHRHAERWLQTQIFFPLKLRTSNIAQVDKEMLSKLDTLERNGTLVDPFKGL